MVDFERKDSGAGVNGARSAAGVVVLGPGRSGTSALMRALIKSGFFAGRDEDLYGPDDGNPLGHFESLAVLAINEDLLKELGSYWWADCPEVEAQLAHADKAVPRMRKVVEELIAAAGSAPVAIKEPRINGLIPLWLPVIDELLHPVLALRDPVEVALSHARRDGTSPSHALASWEAQMALVLQELEGRVVTVAPYAKLMASAEVAEEVVIAAAAHLDPSRATHARPADARSAFVRDLHRQQATGLDRSEYLTRRQEELWDYLRSLPPGDAQLECPVSAYEPRAARAAIQRENERLKMNSAHAILATAHAKVVERAAYADELEVRLAKEKEEIVKAIARAEDETRRAAQLAQDLDAVRNSASWRITAPLRRCKQLLGRAGSQQTPV